MNKVHMAAIGALGAILAAPLAANAAPLGATGPAAGQLNAEQSNLIQVQDRGFRGRSVNRGGINRGGRSVYRGPGVRGGPRVVNRGGYGYWGGHRGYRYARPGYRYYNGWWFPAAAFATGALVAGAIANQGPVYAEPAPMYGGGLSGQHYAWCQQRYVSYRAADNSFQPYDGPRQACVSPYS